MAEDARTADERFFQQLRKTMDDAAATAQVQRDKALRDEANDPCKDVGPMWYTSCKSTAAEVGYSSVEEPIPKPPYAALGMILIALMLLGVVLTRLAPIGDGMRRWIVKPLARKGSRTGRGLKKWWLEE